MTSDSADVAQQPDRSSPRLARLYQAMSEIREGIARAGDVRSMLGVACRVAVDVAGYRLAYAGLVDETAPGRPFVVVESAGDDIGWVDGVRADVDPASPHGATVGTRALRSGETMVVDDLAKQPASAHRPEAAELHGLRSLAMLPLSVGGRLVGGMAVYATWPSAFGTAEVALLERVMGEIRFELERLEAEAALRRSEERYRMLVREASDAMFVVGLDGRFVDVNEAAVRLTGYTEAELGALGPELLAATHDRARVLEDFRRLEVGQVVRSEYPMLRRDGSECWIELTATALPDGRLQGLVRDISKRHEAEQRAARLLDLYAAGADIDRATRQIEDPARLIEEACRIAVEVGGFRLAWVGLVDDAVPGRPVRVAAAAGEALGFLDTTPARAMLEPPAGTPPLVAVGALLADQPLFLSLDDADDPDAARRFGLAAAAMVPLHVGTRVVGGLAVYAAQPDAFGPAERGLVERIAEDVSFRLDALERDRARRAVEAERDRLAHAVEQASEGVFITDVATGQVIYANREFEQITQTPAAVALGRPATQLLGEVEEAPRVLAEIGAARAAGIGWSGEIEVDRSDATRIRVAMSTNPLRDASGAITHLVTTLRDVTAQHELEAKYRQAQKMEAVGQLAGGVAHDFNNLLTAIMGYANLASAEVAGLPVAEDLAAIERTAERAAELTRQLLAFARRSPLVRTVFSPDELVADVAPLLRRLIGEDIELRIERPGASGRILGDANQLQQAIINLVVNARDAMPSGGAITLRTADVTLDDAYVARHAEASTGPHVLVEVADTGTGIPRELVERVFDPFFTTKEQGRGTGLGLSMVLGTVEAVGGSVEVETEPGAGTVFRLLLPCTDQPPSALGAARPEATRDVGRGRTVLVVEDEDGVRSFAVRVLEQAGFRVLEARDGNEAAALVARLAGPLDVILTDVVMPGPSGPETVERIRAIRPGIPALFVTGYASRSMPSERAAGTAVLPKPYSRAAVVAALDELLSDPAPDDGGGDDGGRGDAGAGSGGHDA